jgi:hypothetical protein
MRLPARGVDSHAVTRLPATVLLLTLGLSGAQAVVPAGASPVTPDPAGRSSVAFVLSQTAQQASDLRAVTRAGRPSRARFAGLVPSHARHDAVTSWARSRGYSVVHDGPFVVQVTGPAAALAADLGTRLAPTGPVRATSAPAVPAALAGAVSSVVGLDERPAFRPALAYDPPALQVMSGLTSLAYDPTAGAGTTVGTVNLGPWYAGDLTAFAAAKGLTVAPGQVTQVSVDGSSTVADPQTDDGSSGEVALDVEAVLAAAPGAQQRQYFSANTFAGYVAILDQMTADAAAGRLHTASTSWGLCEQAESPTALASQSAAVQRLVAAGATFFAATGDSGSYDCGYPGSPSTALAVDYPASDPYTVGVGGVRATSTSLGYSFTGWGTSDPVTSGGGGGGVSTVFSRPSWQATSDSSPMRTVPDIAGLADPSTGFRMYETYDGGWVAMGGTSLAAPLSAAGLAVVEGRTGSGPLGNVLPALYAHPEAFRDVTSGTNGAWSAGPGYDRVTGLGVPDWTAVALALALTQPVTPPVTPTPDTQAPGTSLQVSWTGTTTAAYRVDRAFTDPFPSSGFRDFTVTTRDLTTGTTSAVTTTAATSTLTAQPGHSYLVTVTSADQAGNTSPAVSRTFRAPTDDLGLSFSSGWVRQLDGNDFAGTHTMSATAGQTLRIPFHGHTAVVGFLTSSASGYADVYVDGVRTARLNLYSAATGYRVPIRVASTRVGDHVVAIRVVGAHPAGSRGNRVYVDSLTYG